MPPLGLLMLACGRDADARADTTGRPLSTAGRSHRDSAAGYVVAASRHQGTPARKDTARAVKDTVRQDSASAGDSVSAPTLSVRMLPGRFKKDSLSLIATLRAFGKQAGWPVRGPAPAEGALLPEKRIIAFYGNPLSKRMGVLGELPPAQMLTKLEQLAKDWASADPDTPVQPALHLIAVVAQGSPGKDGKYRLRMDSSLIEQVYGWTQQKNALLFLDIQVGQSTVMEELPRLMKFLERPTVHLGLDPEFHMHYNQEGVPPGERIGQLSSKEINFAIETLASLVAKKNIPPKILVVHRFTRPMVRGASDIKLDPHVQVVIDMDGWGQPWLKFDSYKAYLVSEPVQFTGFKLFFKNDTKLGDKLLTPMEVLQLKPRPIYIQYQ